MKLNLGCGKEVKEGFEGVDVIDFGQQFKLDLRNAWPWEDESIDEVYSRYMLPCLTNLSGINERIKFFNELYRILKPNAICTLIVPAWNSAGNGHPHFQEPVKEGDFFFLNKDWRTVNAPEVTEYTCDFEATWGYNMHPSIVTRNQEYQQFALSNYCNAALDLMITLKKKVANVAS